MAHARAVTLLSLLVSATSSWRLAAQCPDGSPPPCSRVISRAPAPNSVAVLYLDNLSRDTADAYLADGLTEEIIIRLSQVRRLEVKSRFESQRFRGRAADERTIWLRVVHVDDGLAPLRADPRYAALDSQLRY